MPVTLPAQPTDGFMAAVEAGVSGAVFGGGERWNAAYVPRGSTAAAQTVTVVLADSPLEPLLLTGQGRRAENGRDGQGQHARKITQIMVPRCGVAEEGGTAVGGTINGKVVQLRSGDMFLVPGKALGIADGGSGVKLYVTGKIDTDIGMWTAEVAP